MDYEMEAARLRLIDVSAPSKAARLPAELLELVLQHLCAQPSREYKPNSVIRTYNPSLVLCSLTCRHWAAQIRPRLFSHVSITSHQDFLSFASFIRSSLAVPGPMRLVVQTIGLTIDTSSRPWMYHTWALLRDVALPNLQTIELTIKSADQGDQSKVGRRKSDESRLDIGFPRTLPSARPFHLHTLGLYNPTFRSHETLIRCLTNYHAEDIRCHYVQWSEGSAVSAPAGRLLSRLSTYPPNNVQVHGCTAISPFIWRLVTAQSSIPGAARRLLYISTSQIDVVMGVLRLFSDECECCYCYGTVPDQSYNLRVYTDPTGGAMTNLSCGHMVHMLTMQVKPSGTVSRICLTTDNPADFLLSSTNLPSDQSTAAPVARDSMPMRLDQLCESLGDTLREVVIAYLPLYSMDETPQGEPADAMRKLRDQMPIMARRHRLVFRISQNKPGTNVYMENIEHDTLLEHVFERGGQYWEDIDLDVQPPPGPSPSRLS